MAVKKIAMTYELYQNKNEQSTAYNKWYARPVINSTLNLKGFARHIAEHNGTYKKNVIKGVLEEITECLVELTSQGVGVKLDGLGTFYPTFEGTGAETPQKYNVAENLKGIHIRFLPERSQDESLTSREFMKKCSLKRVDYNPSDDDDTPDDNDGQG